MQLRDKKFTFLILGLAGLLLFGSFLPFNIPYSTRSKVMVKPLHEWTLSRNLDGHLISVHRNNLKGTVQSYSITEFKRGDAVRFNLRQQLYDGAEVNAGDTLGALYTNEDQMRLVQLKGELEVLKAELDFFSTGQKPEDVQFAQTQLQLASQELETQKKLMDRSEMLMKDSVLSVQQFELAQNEFAVKQLAKKIAEARLLSVMTGEKPEQVRLIQAKIKATELQIKQTQERVALLTLTSPMTGKVALKRNFEVSDDIVTVLDNNKYIGLAPILLAHADNFLVGDEVEVITFGKYKGLKGRIIQFDNVSQIVNRQPVIFVTLEFDQFPVELVPGIMLEIKLYGSQLNPRQYLSKVFTTPS